MSQQYGDVYFSRASGLDETRHVFLEQNHLPQRWRDLQQDSFTISTPEGKLKLQQELKGAINSTLKQRTGFGGIDNVYFTSLVVQ